MSFALFTSNVLRSLRGTPTTSGNSQVAISYQQWRRTVVFPGVRLHTEKNLNRGQTFHHFPLDKRLRREWIKNIRRDPGHNFKVSFQIVGALSQSP